MLGGFFRNLEGAAPKQAGPSQASGSARTPPLLLGALLAAAAPAACFADQLQQIADTYAGSMVQNGSAIGVGVAVVSGNAPPRFFTYGYANSTTWQPFSPDTIFQIGSVTKVFTTNLLGQRVASHYLGLQQPLSNFSMQLGQLQPLTSQATLEEVGDFTAGLIDTPAVCEQGQSPPSCLPNGRPTIAQYTAQDFLAYIQASVPENYYGYAGAPNDPPVPVSTLPAPYNYSDFSIGLLGLLLGSLPNLQIDNNAPDRWFKMVANNITGPLAMRSTYLEVPSSASGRASAGYDRALATATVSNGEVSSISVFNHGGPYATAPNVQIVGGGGSGATATAVLDSSTGTVKAITVSNGGSGYVAPPTVTFSSGTAVAQAVVSGGRIAGISRSDGGAGYNGAPTVTISGGGGSGATATAHNANGHVEFVSVESGGSGYVQPIAVLIDPPPPVQNAIPIWAPAGAISSTLTDMANFAEAALGRSNVGAGITVPPLLSAGFQIAQTPYACNEANPALPCSEGYEASALAWAIDPADSANRVPEVIWKNGGIGGFSTQINLMPQQNLGVVVFANNRGNAPNDATSSETSEIQAPAQIIANNILFALFYGH
jgi:CubicO group peptidase (beta-lactamase class C family)